MPWPFLLIHSDKYWYKSIYEIDFESFWNKYIYLNAAIDILIYTNKVCSGQSHYTATRKMNGEEPHVLPSFLPS